uniref:Uncharacterized protein n=1 Tax=Anguilla anguilla TaxID=7936 RepID=A0A0E9UB53_ANGAN
MKSTHVNDKTISIIRWPPVLFISIHFLFEMCKL